MPENIQFSRELAEELRRELSPSMYELHEPLYGSPYYSCHFCARFCYPTREGAVKLNEIDHMPDCLGERLMKELDEKLALDVCSGCGLPDRPGGHPECAEKVRNGLDK